MPARFNSANPAPEGRMRLIARQFIGREPCSDISCVKDAIAKERGGLFLAAFYIPRHSAAVFYVHHS
jgi:hypothetical protein